MILESTAKDNYILKTDKQESLITFLSQKTWTKYLLFRVQLLMKKHFLKMESFLTNFPKIPLKLTIPQNNAQTAITLIQLLKELKSTKIQNTFKTWSLHLTLQGPLWLKNQAKFKTWISSQTVLMMLSPTFTKTLTIAQELKMLSSKRHLKLEQTTFKLQVIEEIVLWDKWNLDFLKNMKIGLSIPTNPN